MKKLIVFVLALLALFFILSVAKNALAKAAVTSVVKSQTGLKLDVRNLDIGILNTLIRVEGLKLGNPEGFEEPVFIDVPEVLVDYNLRSIIGGKIHLEEVKLDLREVVIVKNKDGALNVNSIKLPAKEKAEEPAEPGKPKPQEPKTPGEKKGLPPIQIDRLSLKIGKVVYKDYSAGGPPKTQEFKINLDEQHENITDVNQLAVLLVSKAIMSTTLSNLAGLDMGGIMKNLGANSLDLQKLGLGQFANMGGAGGAVAAFAAKAKVDEFTQQLQNDEAIAKIKSEAAKAQVKVQEIMEDPETQQAVEELGQKADKALENLQSFFKKVQDENTAQ